MNLIIKLLLTTLVFGQLSAEVERRAAVDIGSGGTKLAIADIETESGQILEMLYETSFFVPYQASLDKSSDGTFDPDTKALGLKVMKEIQDLAAQYQVGKIAAIATSAFRKSNNSQALVKEVKNETSIEIQIIPQREEGEIAFFSALSAQSQNPDEVIVWDIGTGSLQMTTMNEKGELIVYMGEQMGSVAFKSYIIDAIQEKEAETPNPISGDDLKMADSYARAFGRKAYPIIKEKIKEGKQILGMGRLFYNGIRPLVADGDVITRKGLRSFIEESLNKSDDELDSPFAHVDVSNCILTLAIMKALHIQEITAIETTTTRGMLVYPAYW